MQSNGIPLPVETQFANSQRSIATSLRVKKSTQPSLSLLPALDLALPNHQRIPTLLLQVSQVLLVPLYVPLELWKSVICV